MTIEDDWQRDIALANLRDAIVRKRKEVSAAYVVWSRLVEELHRMELEEERWRQVLSGREYTCEAVPITASRSA